MAFGEMDELRVVEERLLREREECERLEAQIRALAIGGSSSGNGSRSGVNSYAGAPQPSRRAPPPPLVPSREPASLRSASAPRGISRYDEESTDGGSRGRGDGGRARSSGARGGRRDAYDDDYDSYDDEDEDGSYTEDGSEYSDEEGDGYTEDGSYDDGRDYYYGRSTGGGGGGYGGAVAASSRPGSASQQRAAAPASALRTTSTKSQQSASGTGKSKGRATGRTAGRPGATPGRPAAQQSRGRTATRSAAPTTPGAASSAPGATGPSPSPSGSPTGAQSVTRAAVAPPTGLLGLPPIEDIAASPINMHKRQASASSRAGVVYRAPMYRSTSPRARSNGRAAASRSPGPADARGAAGDAGAGRVVISSFARAPRFREDKGWVPGPKYNVHTSTFGPAPIYRDGGDHSGPPGAGALGHTWSQYNASTRGALTPQAAHEVAMLRAAGAARESLIAATTPGAGSKGAGAVGRSLSAPRGALGATSASAPRTPGAASTASAVGAGAASASTAGGPGAGSSPAAAAAHLINANNGDARGALEASVARERQLRREVEALQRQLAAGRTQSAMASGALRGEAESAAASVAALSRALEDAIARAGSGKEALSNAQQVLLMVQRAVNELGASLAAIVNAEVAAGTAGPAAAAFAAGAPPLAVLSARFPPLGRLVEAVRLLEDSLGQVSRQMDSVASAARTGREGAAAAAAAAAMSAASPGADASAPFPGSASSSGPASGTGAGAAGGSGQGREGGYLAYSSLSSALAAVGDGASAPGAAAEHTPAGDAATGSGASGPAAASAPAGSGVGRLEGASLALMNQSIAARQAAAAAAAAPASPRTIGAPGPASAAAAAAAAAAAGATAAPRAGGGADATAPLRLGAAAPPALPAGSGGPVGSPGQPQQSQQARTDLAARGIKSDDVLAFARRTRRQTEVIEQRRAGAELVSTAAREGFDVNIAAAAAAEDAAAAEAAYRAELAAAQAQAQAQAAAAAGSPSAGGGGRSPSTQRPVSRASFAGALSAARGRSPSAAGAAAGGGGMGGIAEGDSAYGGGSGTSVTGSSMHLPTGRTAGVSPSKPIVRRLNAGQLREMPAHLAPGSSPLDAPGGATGGPGGNNGKPTTIADVLQQVFKYYCLWGSRDRDRDTSTHAAAAGLASGGGASLGMRSNQFAKLVREAGLLGAGEGVLVATPPPSSPSAAGLGRVTPADVDLAFTRAAAAAAAAAATVGSPHGGPASPSSGAGARAGLGSRIRFEEWLAALNELAVRKYRASAPASGAADSASIAAAAFGGGVGPGAVAADPDAFKALVSDHLLPLYGALKHDALFVLDVAEAGAEASAAAFADAFLREEVLAFFNEHRVALQAMFTRYTMSDRRLDTIGQSAGGDAAAAWAAVKEASVRMSRKALLAWAADHKIVPDMMTRPELLSLAREATKAIGRRDDGGRERDDLTYPEWVELLGLIAYTLGDEKLRGMRPDLVTSLGATAEGAGGGSDGPMMLQRLRLLFVNMFELGAKFEGDGLRMIRAISEAVRRDAAAVRDASARAAAYAASHGRQVRSVLGESVML